MLSILIAIYPEAPSAISVSQIITKRGQNVLSHFDLMTSTDNHYSNLKEKKQLTAATATAAIASHSQSHSSWWGRERGGEAAQAKKPQSRGPRQEAKAKKPRSQEAQAKKPKPRTRSRSQGQETQGQESKGKKPNPRSQGQKNKAK
jgi:hypothetical protein